MKTHIKTRFNYLSILFLTLLFLSCHNSDYIKYEDAIASCKSKIKRDSITKTTFFPSRDCVINSKAPIFSAVDINQKNIKVSFKKPRYTILNFWFIGCKPCVEEIPTLNEISKMKDINVISICRDDESDIKEFMKKKDILFTVIPNGKDIIYGTYKHIFGFPTNYLIDDNGVIVKNLQSLNDRKEYNNLMKLLKE